LTYPQNLIQTFPKIKNSPKSKITQKQNHKKIAPKQNPPALKNSKNTPQNPKNNP
jgi:hypothetical protein